MSFYYSVSALSVLSNIPIPGLRPLPNPEQAPDIVVFLGVSPGAQDGISSNGIANLAYVSTTLDSNGVPMLKMWELDGGAYLHIAYCDGTQFWFDRRGTKLWATWVQDSSVENTSLYLLGPILGLVLRYRGFVCLHASAVIVNHQAVVFMGPEESGKSTTAAAFARKGFLILTDDVVPLREEKEAFFVLPGSPHLRLWPESVEMLFGLASSLPPLLPGWDKQKLSPGDHKSNFCEGISPLGAIYVLKERSMTAGLPRIDPLDKQAALMALISNTYTSQLVDARMQAEEFEFLGRLVSRVPVCQLTPHSDGQRIDELCDVVCADFSNRQTVVPAPRN